MTNTMAIDQYGHTIHGLGDHPRRELCKKLGVKHAKKMYVDRKDGTSAHIGYIIGQRWFTIYTVSPWEGDKPA